MNNADTRLVIKRTFQAPADKLFKAWTTPTLMQEWFAPGDMTVPSLEADVREGGTYRITMLEAGGEKHTTYGTYKEVVPGKRLVYTWQWEGSEEETLVTIEFYSRSERTTELVLTHERFTTVQAKESHNKGWNSCLQNFESWLEAGSQTPHD